MNKIFNEHEYDTKPGTSFDRHLTEPASVFFNGKLRIFSELDLSSREGDVLVNFCASDILSGLFLEINICLYLGFVQVMKHFWVFMNFLEIN